MIEKKVWSEGLESMEIGCGKERLMKEKEEEKESEKEEREWRRRRRSHERFCFDFFSLLITYVICCFGVVKSANQR